MSVKIKGIDISRAQETFDFDAAEKSGVKFIIIRAGIRAEKDTYFKQNLEECLTRGIPYGLYWYFEATDDETFKKELAACKNVVKGLKPQYPIFFDMETQEQIFYCDPPYHTTEKYYDVPFSESDHLRLFAALSSIKGRFLLSYNDDDFVRELYKDYIIVPVERNNNMSSGNFKELLIKNY